MKSGTLKTALAIGVGMLLAVCSGGSSSDGGGASPAATPTTGTFVDSPVDGLHFTSPPSNPAGGFTSGGGHFQCQPGDNVTFDLAGRVIGTPQPCSSNAVTAVSVFGASSITDNRVVNLARLLLTLGGSPNANNNVIQLPSRLPQLPLPLNFSLSTTDFANALQALVPTLVSEATATTHLQASFKTLSVTVVNNGTVTSNPAGISCTAGICSYAFVTDTVVTLTATGTGFSGWIGGGCPGTGTCVVPVNSDSSVTATFTPTGSTLPAFPLVASSNRRYLQDQNNMPFPILGRAAWFITSLSETDYKMFIDDTVAKGYNAIEFHVINHNPRGNHPPFDGNGALPFSKQLDGSVWAGSLVGQAPDFTQTNEPYWTHVDALLAYAESKGVLCFMFPAYTGYVQSGQGWMAEMTANLATNMATYGTFIAARYKTRGNIVWMLGGDYGTAFPFTALELAVEQAMLAGMKSVSGQASLNFSAEWDRHSIYTDQTDATLQAAGTLEAAYVGSGDVNTYARNGYAHSPAMPMPTFLLEEPYDEEGPDGNHLNGEATQPVRRFQWWGWLSGIGGYISGNGYVWPFNPAFDPINNKDDWHKHLKTQGAQDMARLNVFIRSIAWFNLVPSGLGGMRTLVVGNSLPDSSDYVAAAATPDGTLLVAYVPPAHSGSITIDMTVMSGSTRAQWFNPASAQYTPIGTFANTGPVSFTPPRDNGTGFSDWVLLLEKQ